MICHIFQNVCVTGAAMASDNMSSKPPQRSRARLKQDQDSNVSRKIDRRKNSLPEDDFEKRKQPIHQSPSSVMNNDKELDFTTGCVGDVFENSQRDINYSHQKDSVAIDRKRRQSDEILGQRPHSREYNLITNINRYSS